MKRYTQLTEHQRYPIYALMKAGITKARQRRNRGGRGYRLRQAQRLARRRRQASHRTRILAALWQEVHTMLLEEWSPEQFSLFLRHRRSLRLSHEWIYRHVLRDKAAGGTLYRHLRCQRQRKKRYGAPSRRGQIKDTVSIEARPAIVAAKGRIGDWEVDTVIGKGQRQALVTLNKRRSMYTHIAQVKERRAETFAQTVVRLLSRFKHRVHAITSDNGKEFAAHRSIARKLKADFYFAPPHAPWERGENENINGLVRQYSPKCMDFCTITEQQLQQVMDKLNHRPRKTLDVKTPHEVFFNIPVALQS